MGSRNHKDKEFGKFKHVFHLRFVVAQKPEENLVEDEVELPVYAVVVNESE